MLEEYRQEIDEIDRQLVALFEKRMDVAQKVGAYKKANGMEIFVPEREKAIVEQRTQQTKNPAYRKYTAEIFESLMCVSRNLQSSIVEEKGDISFHTADFQQDNLRIVYPGTAGSYSGEAVKKHFQMRKMLSMFPPLRRWHIWYRKGRR